ncbi:MAG: recombination protein RecR [Fusobacteriaceae bacterium]|nr:recombination protein RecR [Fusobacteriaceae bacterium]MBN2837264.1 recombination protein RecR [Fusobacteriaceae bacterium]
MATKSIELLTEEFNKLPSIGRKTAQRLAFAILEMEKEEVERFAKALIEVKEKVKKCIVCGNFSEEEICDICKDDERDRSVICVVEDSKDIIALERAKMYRGLYHVLHGKIAPLNGKTLEQLNIQTLVERVAKNNVNEVIMALNPDLEGETTSMYLTRLLKNFDIKISRIASGIPMGGNLEYSDMATLIKSIEGRRELKED